MGKKEKEEKGMENRKIGGKVIREQRKMECKEKEK